MEQDAYRQVLPYLPSAIGRLLEEADPLHLTQLEEIRLRPEIPVLLRCGCGEGFLCADGSLSDDPAKARLLTGEEMRKTVLLLTDSSLYALEEELRRGYVTLPGGHRAGLCGRAVLSGGRVRTMRDISAIDIRIARHVSGSAAPLLPRLTDEDGKLRHTLVVSQPGGGKTTLLRDIAKAVSNGEGAAPMRVGMIDERSELAALRSGIPQLPVGVRTDVLDGCPKAEGMGMMLRSMGPELIVCDEIGRPEDAAAIRDAVNSGVRLLASAHGGSEAEIRNRPVLAELLAEGVFERMILLSRRHGPGTVEWLKDGEMRPC